MRGRASISALLLALALLCAGLGGLVYVQLQGLSASPSPASASGAAAELPEPQPLPEVEMPAKQEFSAIVERPLFSPSRRPAEGGETAAAPAQALEIALTGVIISEDERIALLRPQGRQRTLRLRQGDTYEGWTVADIREHSVTFRRDGSETEVELKFEEGGTAPGQKRAPEGRQRGSDGDRPERASQ